MCRWAIILTVFSFVSVASAWAQDTSAEASPKPTADDPHEIAVESHASVAAPNAVSLEALGRAALYSFNYDRLVTPDVAVGVGFAFLKSSTTIPVGDALPDIVTSKAVVLPVYVNYYFNRQAEQHFFATAGVDLVFASISGGSADQIETTFEGSGVAGVIGGGYEYRTPGEGFVFRAAPYILFSGTGVKPWLGLSFGFSF